MVITCLVAPLPTFRSRIPAERWEQLVSGARMVHVPAGGSIYRTGAPAEVAAVLAGRARVFTWTPGGRKVTLRYTSPGHLLGLTALLSGADACGAEAVTDNTLAVFPVDHIRALASRHPDLSWALAELLVGAAAEAARNLAADGHDPITVRVARHLIDIATETPDGELIAHVTHQRLADAVGTAREVITRVLTTFRQTSLVSARPGCVVLLDGQRLADIAARKRRLRVEQTRQ